MKQFKNILLIACGSLLVLGACENAELDLTSNPNALSPEQANADFFLNAIQEDFALWVHNMGDMGGEFVRINYMNGRTYNNIYSPSNLDDEWEEAYQDMLQDIKLMNALTEDLAFYQGMGKVIEAYIMLTLVDYFGDVPYSEALRGDDAENPVLNPVADPGASVYQAALALLDAAIQDFNAEGTPPTNDFFYNGDGTKWIKAANSIKKKAYLNLGDSAAFNAITNYIEDPADDFQFRWGTNEVQPDTRHPFYRNNYTATGGGEYMSNWLMSVMLEGHGNIKDPRMAYYFYRQVAATPGFGADPDEETLECSLPGYLNPYPEGVPFCGLSDGYWGRDHGNDNGIPPDGFLRTLRGIYPGGGRFDDRSFEGTAIGGGAKGKGITPVMLSSWMHFMKAEVNGFATAEADVMKAIEQSINKAASNGGGALDSEVVTSYLAAFQSDWAIADLNTKGNLWAKQFFIALTGNGTDGYNSYRRNGFPTDVQPNIEPSPGNFPVIMYYPANYVTNNANAEQRSNLDARVFWNTGGATNLK